MTGGCHGATKRRDTTGMGASVGVGVGVGLGVAVAVAAGADVGVGVSVAESPQAKMKRIRRVNAPRRMRIMGPLDHIFFMLTIL